MGISIWQLIICLSLILPPLLGVIRGVKNNSIPNAIASVFIPLYGLFYFYLGRKKQINW